MTPYEAALRVVRAWQTPGPLPWRHASTKRRFRRDWPALAKAIDALEDALADAERNSPG